MKINAFKMLFAFTLTLAVLTSCGSLRHHGNGGGRNDHGNSLGGGNGHH